MEDPGHYRCYAPKNFNETALKLIAQMNAIIDEYEPRGYTMTVRQLYYQMVQRGLIPNEQKSYKTIAKILSEGRLAGLVSWTALEDRTRNLRGLKTWKHPREAVKAAAEAYRTDLWKNQDVRPEVWIEKDALVGVIADICNNLRVDFFSCRGYSSQSEQWRAGQRFADYLAKGQRPIVFHLGDHDPSGLDMTRDNSDRLSMFAGVPIQVVRLGLNWNQIEELRPPPNPAKSEDPRFADYRAKYGLESWELDALPPDYVANLIRKSVEAIRDPKKWDDALAVEVADRGVLLDFAEEL